MKTVTELILQKLRETFDQNRYVFTDPNSAGNMWLMLSAIVPYERINDKEVTIPIGVQPPNCINHFSIPTHVARIVARTTDKQQGTNDYVDGTDLFMIVDEENQRAEFAWEDLWAEGPPIFHGGTVPAALTWVREFAEPFYLQLKDPFLTLEQRIALNGHDEDYKLPEEQKESSTSNKFNPDDIDKWI